MNSEETEEAQVLDKIGSFEEKLKLAAAASSRQLHLILKTDNPSPAEAAELSGAYVAYGHEIVFYALELDKAKLQLGMGQHETGYDLKKGIEWKGVTIREETSALFKTQQGDYSGIRELIEFNSAAEYSSNLRQNIEDPNNVCIKLLRFAQRIPDHGKPFIPPPPAGLEAPQDR